MATTPIHRESVPATHRPLSLFDASCSLEDIAGDIEEASALVFGLSRDDDMPDFTRRALRAVSTLLNTLEKKASRESERFMVQGAEARALQIEADKRDLADAVGQRPVR